MDEAAHRLGTRVAAAEPRGATVALSALTAGSVTCAPTGCGVDETRFSLGGVQVGQAVVAVLAVLTVGNEYSSGMIRTTLSAVPRRSVALAAKAAVLVGPVLAAGAVAVAGSLLVGGSHLRLSLGAASTLRAAAGSVLYLALVALLSLGLATVVRDSAAAIGTVLGLLYLFPTIATVVTNPHWHRRVQQVGPSSGLAIQATRGLPDLPIGPWAGLGVLGLWAGGALLLGGLLLHTRDA